MSRAAGVAIDVRSLQEGREGYFGRESQERVNEATPAAAVAAAAGRPTSSVRRAPTY
jgi:hypothetical protein